MKIQAMAVQHGAFNREKSSAESRRAQRRQHVAQRQQRALLGGFQTPRFLAGPVAQRGGGLGGGLGGVPEQSDRTLESGVGAGAVQGREARSLGTQPIDLLFVKDGAHIGSIASSNIGIIFRRVLVMVP